MARRRSRRRCPVPDGWDTLGLFPVQQPHGQRGWHYPNRPGSRHTTWVDAIELRLGHLLGWTRDGFEIHEAIKMTKTEPLYNYAKKITAMVELAEAKYAENQKVARVITGAIKHMYRVTIGTFARSEALTTRFTKDERDIPADVVSTRTLRDIDTDEITGYEYEIHDRPSDRDSWHPEIAATVWAFARARVLSNRSTFTAEPTAGAILIEPDQLIGIQGDAVYTTTVQDWSLPVDLGGEDDGRNGRLRLKGVLPGPMPVPVTRAERLDLSKLADAAGYTHHLEAGDRGE